jgi:hypothetical protein
VAVAVSPADADAGAAPRHVTEAPTLMLAMMPADVACSYQSPPAHPITLRAAPDASADLLSLGSTGISARLVITQKGVQFMELTGLRLRARGYPKSDELASAREITFNDILVIPRAVTVVPVAGARGKVLIAPPQIDGVRFVTSPTPVELPCDALTMDYVAGDTSPPSIGAVMLGDKARDLYGTPGGPVLAVLDPTGTKSSRRFWVVGRQHGYLRVSLVQGSGRLTAWVKDAGLTFLGMARLMDLMQQDMIDAMSGDGGTLTGVLGSGVTPPGESSEAAAPMGRLVHCKEQLTLTGARGTTLARIPILTLKDAELRVGDARGGWAPVDVMSPQDITAVPGGMLEARVADLEACAAP